MCERNIGFLNMDLEKKIYLPLIMKRLADENNMWVYLKYRYIFKYIIPHSISLSNTIAEYKTNKEHG